MTTVYLGEGISLKMRSERYKEPYDIALCNKQEFGANYKLSGIGQGGYLQRDVYGEYLRKKQEWKRQKKKKEKNYEQWLS